MKITTTTTTTNINFFAVPTATGPVQCVNLIAVAGAAATTNEMNFSLSSSFVNTRPEFD
jgi:hypothetical protein